MKKSGSHKKPAKRTSMKGYADGGYVPERGTKSVKAVGAPVKPAKFGKLF